MFTFQAKLVVVDADKKNIFNPTTDRDGNVDVDALALTADNKKKNKRANFADFKDRKQKCKDAGGDKEDCKRSAQQEPRTLAFWLQQQVAAALGLLSLSPPHALQVLSSVRMVSLFQMVPPPALMSVQEDAALMTTALAVSLTPVRILPARCAKMGAAMAMAPVMRRLSHRW